MDVRRGLLSSGDVQVAPARRAGTDEDRVVIFGQQRLHAVDPLAQPHLETEVGDVADLLVDHLLRQAEVGDLAADHAAGARVAIIHHAVIAERGEIAGHGQRGRTGADQGDALAIVRRSRFRQARADVALVVGGDAFQAADRHRLLLDAPAAAGRLAGPVTGASENPGEHVGAPVDHVGIGVAAGGDQADVFRHRGVRGTRVLAVHDLVEILRVPDIGRLQVRLLPPCGAGFWQRRLRRRRLLRPSPPRRQQRTVVPMWAAINRALMRGVHDTSPALRGLGPRSGPRRRAERCRVRVVPRGTTLTRVAARRDLSREERERCTQVRPEPLYGRIANRDGPGVRSGAARLAKSVSLGRVSRGSMISSTQ